MEIILGLLPILICPVVMGALMWMMSRGNKDRAPNSPSQANLVTRMEPPKPAQRGGVFGILSMCLNWKVLAGLGLVGLGMLVVAPNLAVVALPVLVALACPISMLFMLRGMQGDRCDQCGSRPEHTGQPVAFDYAHADPPTERLLTREAMTAVEPREDR